MNNKPKRPRDPNQLAKLVVDMATGETPRNGHREPKDPAAVSLGRKGGRARASKLSKERRKQIARQAAKVRWGKNNPK